MRPVILCVAMAVMVFSLYRRDWAAPAPPSHQRWTEQDDVDFGLRDCHIRGFVHGYFDVDQPFLYGRDLVEAGGRAYRFGWAAIIACAIAAALFVFGRATRSARVSLLVPLVASMWTAIAYSRTLNERLFRPGLGQDAYLMSFVLVVAAAAILWPRSSRSRSPAESLPQARAKDRERAPAGAARAP